MNAEHVLVELIREDGLPAKPGEEGLIAVTDFNNRAMPLIRYVVGDTAVLSADKCSCGRELPMLARLVGRSADYLLRRDGSRVAGISLVEKTLTAVDGLAQLQIVQTDIDQFTLNVVPGDGFGEASRNALAAAIRDAFGPDAKVVTAEFDRLPQERNSKYRFSICQVPERSQRK